MDTGPPRQDRVVAATLLETLRRDTPGFPTDNRYEQSRHLRGIPYVAVRAIYDWLGSATVVVTEPTRRRPVRKALRSPSPQSRDQDYTPVRPDHPLARLFEWVNDTDTFPQFMAQWVIQLEMTGNVYVWTPANASGRPSSMWILPTALCTPIHPSRDYPDGAWRVNLAAAGGWMPVMGRMGALQAILHPSEVLHYRLPHPLCRWDGYSPLTAMAREIDQYDAIQESRITAFNHGSTPDVVLSLKGAGGDEIQRVADDWRNKHAGARNHRRTTVVNADDVKISTLNPTAKEMDFPQSWEQAVKASLAGFGVLASLVGLSDAASYAAFYASRQQMLTSKIQPMAHGMSAFLTKHLARKFYGPQLRVQVDPGSVNDHELLEKQISSDAANHAITVNQIQALRDRDPVEGGDVPPEIYVQWLAQKVLQPQPQAGGAGSPDGADPARVAAPGGGHPLDALGDAVLQSLGVQGAVAKAVPWEEDKHARRGGKFAPKGGAIRLNSADGANAATPSGNGATGSNSANSVPDAVKSHPKVRAALGRLAGAMTGVAAKVTQALAAVGMTPEDALGTFDDWSRILVTHHADVVAHALGVDALTAGHVLTHLAAEGLAKLKGLLGGAPADPSTVDTPAATRPDGSDGGPPRPDNPDSEGSLPSRVAKAFDALELVGALDEFLETLGGEP
jgi:phage portal protein BeeE